MWIAFTLWPVTVHWYGIAYLTAFLWGYLIIKLCNKWWLRNNPQPINQFINQNLDDILFWTMIGVLWWGRLWHVLIYDPWYYLAHPTDIVKIWQWGMSFVWWFIGVALTTLSLCRHHKLTLKQVLNLLDWIVLVLPVGIIAWRYANYLNQELVGKIISSEQMQSSINSTMQSLNLWTTYSRVDTALRWNTNRIELAWEWIIWALIVWTVYYTMKRAKKWTIWRITWWFTIWYSLIRIILETFRDNPPTESIGMINKTHIFMVLFLLAGIYVLIRWKKQTDMTNTS